MAWWELCGGEARVTTLAVRRRLTSGGNFDIITQCDLNEPSCQQEVLEYLRTSKPLVVVVAPTCRPFGPRSHMNKLIH